MMRPSLLLHAQRIRRARRVQHAARPVEIGPYSRIRLAMVQQGSTLHLEAWTGPSLHLEGLWLLFGDQWRSVGTWESVQEVVDGSDVLRHRAVLDLDVAPPEEEGDEGSQPPGEDGEAPAGTRTSVWVSIVEDRQTAPRFAAEVETSEDGILRYRVPLGRFRRTPPTTFEPVEGSVGQQVRPYVNRNGHLALAVDSPLRPTVRTEVTALRVIDGRLVLEGAVASGYADLLDADLVLVGRDGEYRSTSPLTLTPDPDRSMRAHSGRFYTMDATHDFRGDLDGRLAQDTIADLWIEARTADGEIASGRIGRTPFLVRQATDDGWASVGGTTLAVTPYYTFKAKYPALHLELFPTEVHRTLQDQMQAPLRSRLRRAGNDKPVWLLGERPTKAQDNGLHLFRHLRTHHPEIDAYYVITPDSPERAHLEGLDHVVDYRSTEHVELVTRADRIIGTHHPDFLYPTRSPRFARQVHAPRVFLQHGVMGTKWMALNYGKQVASFRTDLFLVSSEREREYIISDFGYRPEEVAVTGLARFDRLFDGQTPLVEGQILILPTWRDWLQSSTDVTESEYYREWHALLTSSRLAELVRRHGGQVVFCLHPNMQQYAAAFAAAGVRVVLPGEVDVQTLLKQSAVLITDYSSPGFDFSFLDKPVLYFQFDVRRFLGRWGSHLDLVNELPGPVAADLDTLLDRLEQTLERGATIEPRYAKRAGRFLAHRDQDNAERIIAAIHQAQRSRSRWSEVTGGESAQLVLRHARRHRYYYPAMRRLLALARMLPARDAILFESGLGRQYGDSPRAIYEELLRRGDHRPRIWVHRSPIQVWDPQLTVVERLSPGYFWHLGRSRAWVNNQNFPHYVRRRRDGVYLQTWHGTPLKRMLHDLDTVVGRDDGYIERVDRAISQWTTLLSPSPYATRAFRSAFAYDGEVLELGYPRNDVLAPPLDPTLVEQVRQRLMLPEGKRVVLYAPTFRDSEKRGRGFTFELPFDLERVTDALGEDVVLVLRMHVLIAGALEIPAHLRDQVIDASRYRDIQELFLVSDVLVTDYSSAFFDYALLRRPMVFHAYDLESYRDELRGFYLDYAATVPGPVTSTEDELIAALRERVAPGAPADPQIDDFLARFAPDDDGHAAQRAVNALLRAIEARRDG